MSRHFPRRDVVISITRRLEIAGRRAAAQLGGDLGVISKAPWSEGAWSGGVVARQKESEGCRMDERT